ncbi:response regulator [Caballeronia hypogeia]|uniref:response regulator n=1 Tax=Caballeronia hypogeia TaxID=1777140 RepID=UPI0007726D94
MTMLALIPRRWTSRSLSINGRAPRVLVVDDNSNAADALAVYLGFSRLDVRVVYDGAAAIATALSWRPDVVLLDISMPVVDGFVVAKTLRDNARTSGAFIVALTAHDEGFVRQRAAESEFDAYCQKGQVLDTLSQLLTTLTHGVGHSRIAR